MKEVLAMVDKKALSTAEVVGGMAMLLLGHKVKGLALFGHGIYGLEKIYRENNPDLEPGFDARWNRAVEFYESTHQDETNRTLHRLGIPVIVSGAVGLFVNKPYQLPWLSSAATFAVGWAMNIVGHGVYEKNKPAFTEDPLAFVAGPVWDIKQMVAKSSPQESPTG